MIRRRLARAIATAAVALALRGSSLAASAPERPWLFVSDVHYDRYASRNEKPNHDRDDTDPQLFASFLAEAKRVDPDPPVVVIAGDFIAHHAYKADALDTMTTLARAFDATFPKAQFLITLGNNDSSCGDYVPPLGGPFLSGVAKAWAPLVDRGGAAPRFEETFARDASYVARLPEANLRAVVINDNFFTMRYTASCATPQAPAHVLAALHETLSATPAGVRNVVLFHVPPGVDAYSTSHLTHGLFVVPFLRPRSRDALDAQLGDPASHVVLAIAGHTHRFSFHVVPASGGKNLPMLLVPSISPIFGNYPSFLVGPMEPGGTLGDLTQYAFDGNAWTRLGDLASVGVPRFEAPALLKLQDDLLKNAAYRTRFAELYEGGGPSEIVPKIWSVYACAMIELNDAAFESCTGKRGYSILTRRGVALAAAIALALAVAAAVVFGLRLRARRRAEFR